MIKSFRCKDTAKLFESIYVKRFAAIERQARIKLLLINAAYQINDLRCPPGNRLEVLSGDRDGQLSMRINHQWRVCFYWRRGHAYEVEIVDYH